MKTFSTISSFLKTKFQQYVDEIVPLGSNGLTITTIKGYIRFQPPSNTIDS